MWQKKFKIFFLQIWPFFEKRERKYCDIIFFFYLYIFILTKFCTFLKKTICTLDLKIQNHLQEISLIKGFPQYQRACLNFSIFLKFWFCRMFGQKCSIFNNSLHCRSNEITWVHPGYSSRYFQHEWTNKPTKILPK